MHLLVTFIAKLPIFILHGILQYAQYYIINIIIQYMQYTIIQYNTTQVYNTYLLQHENEVTSSR